MRRTSTAYTKVATGSSLTHHIVTFSREAQSLASSSANAYFLAYIRMSKTGYVRIT
jgi:hypothetical protein